MKYSKQKVQYINNHGTSDEQCSKCIYYVSLYKECKIVKGYIDPDGWCKEFKRKANLKNMTS